MKQQHPGAASPRSGDPRPAYCDKLDRDAINALPLFHFEGKITLVRAPKELDAAMERLSAEKVLGFDTETRPSFRKGKSYSPTLVQLAVENEVFLFHLKWMPLGSDLLNLLRNPELVKTGVAVHDDMRFLAGIRAFTPRAVVDLGEVARRHNIGNRGLRAMAAAFLGLRISKTEQCSNWGRADLSPRQIRYAATDAWISRAVYFSMLEAGLDMSETSPQPRNGQGAGAARSAEL